MFHPIYETKKWFKIQSKMKNNKNNFFIKQFVKVFDLAIDIETVKDNFSICVFFLLKSLKFCNMCILSIRLSSLFSRRFLSMNLDEKVEKIIKIQFHVWRQIAKWGADRNRTILINKLLLFKKSEIFVEFFQILNRKILTQFL